MNAPTICKCGSAKSYHSDSHPRDHNYTPRYDPESWREGYEAAIRAETPATRTDALDVDLIERLRKNCIRMFWLARKPCDEYDDGRELCVTCEARAVLARLATPPEAQAVPEGWPTVDGQPFNPVVKWTPSEGKS